jgi:two-component system, LuxR family, sensor kinase FixL
MDKSIDGSHMNGEFAGEYSIDRADHGSNGAQPDRSVQVINQYMTLAAEAANIGFWCRDYDREEFWASDRWRALFGFTSSESLHIEKFFQCLHPNDRESTRQALEDAYQGDGTYQTEHSVLLPDGQVRWISCHGRLELGADNQPLRLLGVSVDITQRKLAELEARAHRNNAAHLLRVASLVELSASLAHELRQPLTAILGNVEAAQLLLAAENCNLQEVREILGDVVADDERAGDMVDRMRMLLKRGTFQPQPVEANQLIRDVVQLMNLELTGRGVQIVTDLPPESLPICVDRVQLQQVLLNLTLNAVDSMSQSPNKNRTLTLRSRRLAGELVQISVTDTGRGILPGREEAIFESHYTTKPDGLGLGLSLSRRILAAHGGQLRAENHGSNGATFHCTIPEYKDRPASQSPAG